MVLANMFLATCMLAVFMITTETVRQKRCLIDTDNWLR